MGRRLPCSPRSPSSFDFLFLHPSIIFSLESGILYFTLCGVMVYGLLRLSLFVPSPRPRFISRLLRGHLAVIRTLSAISSIFLFELPVGNQIATYTKKRNRAALILRDFCRRDSSHSKRYYMECKATLYYNEPFLANINSSLITKIFRRTIVKDT